MKTEAAVGAVTDHGTRKGLKLLREVALQLHGLLIACIAEPLLVGKGHLGSTRPARIIFAQSLKAGYTLGFVCDRKNTMGPISDLHVQRGCIHIVLAKDSTSKCYRQRKWRWRCLIACNVGLVGLRLL